MNYLKLFENYFSGFIRSYNDLPEEGKQQWCLGRSKEGSISLIQWNGINFISFPGISTVMPYEWKYLSDEKLEIDEYMFGITDMYQVDSSEDIIYSDRFTNGRNYFLVYKNIHIEVEDVEYINNYLYKLKKTLERDYEVKIYIKKDGFQNSWYEPSIESLENMKDDDGKIKISIILIFNI